MGLGREISGLARSIKYDLRRSRRARMYLIVGVFSVVAVAALVLATARMSSLAAEPPSGSADGAALGPAGLTEQHGSTPGGQGNMDSQDRPGKSSESPSPSQSITESGGWEIPEESPSEDPEPDPDPTPSSPTPDPSDPESPSESPSPGDPTSPGDETDPKSL
jgi:hypothetical protein